jgi:hypothetical protein
MFTIYRQSSLQKRMFTLKSFMRLTLGADNKKVLMRRFTHSFKALFYFEICIPFT